MGCDIHSYAEKKVNGKWEKVGEIFPMDEWLRNYYKKDFDESPFDWRSYAMFGFLADVRNYSNSEYLSEPKGLPDDISKEVKEKADYWDGDGHSHSFLTVKELIDFDYGKTFFDDMDEQRKNYKSFLGKGFFEDLEILKNIDKNPENVRVVFWFDN